MKRLSMRSRLGGLSLALALITSVSDAAMISPPDLIEPVQTADWSSTINVSKFDASLGTLNSIFIQTVATANVNAFLQNTANTPETFSFGMGVEVTTLLPNSTTLVADPLAATPHTVTLPSLGGSTVFGGPTTYSGSSSATLSGASMAPFIGNGTLGLPTETSTTLSFTGGGGNIQASLSTLIGETFHIEYEYSPVPEASTCGVIAGLGCLVALARRLRS